MARAFADLFSLALCGWFLVAALAHADARAAETQPEAQPEISIDLTLDEAIELATQWLEQGRLEPAERLVAKLRAAPDPRPQVLFLSAHIKLAKGDLPGAIDEFRRILRQDPKAVRVRLDLALALYRTRDYTAALYHFELALSADLPPQAKANALRFVRDIRQRESYWELTLGLASDSNINYATRATNVSIADLQFRLNENARAQSGIGLVLNLWGREAFGKELDHFVNFYLEDDNYEGGAFDFFYTVATFGQTFPYRDHDFSIEAGAHYANWGERTLYEGPVAKITDNWRLRPDTQLVTSIEAKELRYPSSQFLSGNQYALNVDIARAFFSSTSIRLGGSLLRQYAQENPFGYHGYNIRAEAQTELAHSFTVGVRVDSTHLRYDAPDPLFGVQRRDRRNGIELTLLRRDIQWRGFSPRLILGYSRGTSTIPIDEFDRRYVRIAMTRQF